MGMTIDDTDAFEALYVRWDVRTSRSRTGAICAMVGQVLDGRLGLVGLDRRFRLLPEGAADTCSREQPTGVTLAGARGFRGGGRCGPVMAVSGVAARGVRDAVVFDGAGRLVGLRVGPERAFLAAIDGHVDPRARRLADLPGGAVTSRAARPCPRPATRGPPARASASTGAR